VSTGEMLMSELVGAIPIFVGGTFLKKAE